MKISKENYLKVIYSLESSQKDRIKTQNLADYLAISPASVTEMLKKLADEKYISYIDDSNGSPQSKHHLDDLPHAEQPEHPDHAAVSLGPLHDHLRSAVRSQQTESHRH